MSRPILSAKWLPNVPPLFDSNAAHKTAVYVADDDEIEKTDTPHAHPSCVSSVSSVSSVSQSPPYSSVVEFRDIRIQITEAIELTRLSKEQTSRIYMFDFVRRVKAILRLHQRRLTPEQHKTVHDLWESRNHQYLRPGQDYFPEYMARLSVVRFPHGEQLIAAYQRALAAMPTTGVLVYSAAAAHVLANICRELQLLAGDKPFYLACRSAATLLKRHYTTVAMWLRGFQELGIIELVEHGKLLPDKKQNRASRYRYTAPD
jgi:hypothetical protein